MLALGKVCSGVSLSPPCQRVMSHRCSTFPPCLSAAACPPSTVTPFSSPSLRLPVDYQFAPQILALWLSLSSWVGGRLAGGGNTAVCLLPGCINIYLSFCSMSPANTLLSPRHRYHFLLQGSWAHPRSQCRTWQRFGGGAVVVVPLWGGKCFWSRGAIGESRSRFWAGSSSLLGTVKVSHFINL